MIHNVLPGAHGQSPWERFSGHKPSGRQYRVFGCLCFYHVVNPASKMHARAHRACHLGRAPDQPGYCLYDLEDLKVVVTPHVRFVESVCPGFGQIPAKGEPTADDIFPDFSTPTPPDGFDPPLAPPITDIGPLDAPDDNDAAPPVVDGGRLPKTPTFGERPISSRLNVRSRAPARLPNVGTLGGSFNATSSAFCHDVPEQGGYWMYLGSGPNREGDVRWWSI